MSRPPHGCLNSRLARHASAVADLLGHSSISVTGDVYGHTSDDAPPRRYRGSERGTRPITSLLLLTNRLGR
jgi:integrase